MLVFCNKPQPRTTGLLFLSVFFNLIFNYWLFSAFNNISATESPFIYIPSSLFPSPPLRHPLLSSQRL